MPATLDDIYTLLKNRMFGSWQSYLLNTGYTIEKLSSQGSENDVLPITIPTGNTRIFQEQTPGYLLYAQIGVTGTQDAKNMVFTGQNQTGTGGLQTLIKTNFHEASDVGNVSPQNGVFQTLNDDNTATYIIEYAPSAPIPVSILTGYLSSPAPKIVPSVTTLYYEYVVVLAAAQNIPGQTENFTWSRINPAAARPIDLGTGGGVYNKPVA